MNYYKPIRAAGVKLRIQGDFDSYFPYFPFLPSVNQNSMFALLKSRWLLAQNGLYRYVNTRIMTAAVDPKPEKLRQDVILKFRNLKVTVRTLNVHFSPFLLG